MAMKKNMVLFEVKSWFEDFFMNLPIVAVVTSIIYAVMVGLPTVIMTIVSSVKNGAFTMMFAGVGYFGAKFCIGSGWTAFAWFVGMYVVAAALIDTVITSIER